MKAQVREEPAQGRRISFREGHIHEAEDLEIDFLKTIHTCILQGKCSWKVSPQGYEYSSIKTSD